MENKIHLPNHQPAEMLFWAVAAVETHFHSQDSPFLDYDQIPNILGSIIP